MSRSQLSGVRAIGAALERGEPARLIVVREDARGASIEGLLARAREAGIPVQRSAEILLEEARAHLAGETTLTEIRFVLFGEPMYRLFEMANDAAKVAEQMARMRKR